MVCIAGHVALDATDGALGELRLLSRVRPGPLSSTPAATPHLHHVGRRPVLVVERPAIGHLRPALRPALLRATLLLAHHRGDVRGVLVGDAVDDDLAIPGVGDLAEVVGRVEKLLEGGVADGPVGDVFSDEIAIVS